jgi:hypothetical protein
MELIKDTFGETELTIKILLGLYNVFSRPEFVYGNETWLLRNQDKKRTGTSPK